MSEQKAQNTYEQAKQDIHQQAREETCTIAELNTCGQGEGVAKSELIWVGPR